ncbi:MULTISPECIES: hypothetical protein [Alphaproteobacteria]|uniref:hypothetical protein n=1 Tax=Alphaproteobacteria TaxID=28211 RepID=UPI0032633A53
MLGPSRNIPTDVAMCINLALVEGHFDAALRLIARLMRLSGTQISDGTLTHLTSLAGEFGVLLESGGRHGDLPH